MTKRKEIFIMKKEKRMTQKKVVSDSDKKLANFLTLLCATQKIIMPKTDDLKNGTMSIFNAYKPEGKVVGFNNCSGKDRNAIFDSFGKTFKFQNLTLEMKKVETPKGAVFRAIKFKGNEPKKI